MRYLQTLLVTIVSLLPTTLCYGNGITFSNLRQGSLDYTGGSMEVLFDVSWLSTKVMTDPTTGIFCKVLWWHGRLQPH